MLGVLLPAEQGKQQNDTGLGLAYKPNGKGQYASIVDGKNQQWAVGINYGLYASTMDCRHQLWTVGINCGQ